VNITLYYWPLQLFTPNLPWYGWKIAELSLKNNHSLTRHTKLAMIWLKNCWVVVKEQSLTHSHVTPNLPWYGWKIAELSLKNNHSLTRHTKLAMIRLKNCWVVVKEQSLTHTSHQRVVYNKHFLVLIKCQFFHFNCYFVFLT
jgi:hypothetical protein